MVTVGRIGGGHVVPVSYSYLGYPTTDGVPDSPTGSWTGYASAYNDWKFGGRTIPSSAHSGGAAVAVNVYIENATNGNNTYVTMRDSTGTLLGYADASGNISSDSWTGDLTLTEASAGSLDFDSADGLEIGLDVDGNTVADYLGRDTGDTTSGITYAYSTDSGSTPPTSMTLTGSSSTGLGAILKYIAS